MSSPFFLRPITADEISKIEADPTSVEKIAYPEAEEKESYPGSELIDFTWDMLKYCLVKINPALGSVIIGDRYIEHNLTGSGQWYLTPDEVKNLSEMLNKISHEELAQQIDIEDMIKKNVYGVNAEDAVDQIAGYVEADFKSLKELFSKAAINGMGVLTWM